MKKLLLIPAILTLCVLASSTASAFDLDADLTQEILPLECVFQIVNDGSGTVLYLTPTECGHPLPPDPETHGPKPTPQKPTVITTIETGNGVVQIPFVPVTGSQPSRLSQVLGNTQYLPYSSLSNVKEREAVTQTDDGWTRYLPPAPVVIIAVITIILILVVLFV